MKSLCKTVVPTPRECALTGKCLSFSKFTVKNDCLAAPYAMELGQSLLSSTGADTLVFAKLAHNNREAYAIDIKSSGVTIKAAGETAFIHAMSTLVQLAAVDGDKVILPEGEIADHPEFELRGVNWNLFVEARGWSQDAGDGQDAFVERFTSGLDTLAYFKLNAAFIDGFGWNPERFPGYAALMRRLNQEARRRGVKLIFGGYNAGYGAQWQDFDGPKFRNLRSYPDGEPYPCLDPQRHSEISSTMGTCLSNQELNELKKRNLREFVRAVEPGMLYIHGMDIAFQREGILAWAARCPECRRRWPNDDVNAADGMAGAFAAFYDELCEAIAAVKNPESGYDAARDCAVAMVSPNYTWFVEDDQEWRFHLEYFKTLSSCLRSKSVFLGLREQFFNQAEGGPRFVQLREAVGADCKLAVIYFSSGSSFYNSLPVTADAACVRYFEGMDAVIAGSGNAFQEPRQALDAEYMWNPRGSAFKVDLPERGAYNSFVPAYHDLTYGRVLPEPVFGDNGLLETVCRKLYGAAAGKLVAATQRPKPLPGFDPEPIQSPSKTPTLALAPVAPLYNEMLPGYHFSVFHKFRKVVWSSQLNTPPATYPVDEYAARCETLMAALVEVGERAAEVYRMAASRCASELPLKPQLRKAHLERMAATCAVGAQLVDFTRRWLHVFLDAHGAVRRKGDKTAALVSIRPLERELTAFLEPLRAANAKAIDPNGGDYGQGLRAVEFMLQDLSNISYTLQTGEYRKIQTVCWW